MYTSVIQAHHRADKGEVINHKQETRTRTQVVDRDPQHAFNVCFAVIRFLSSPPPPHMLARVERKWKGSDEPQTHLFADARSTPPRIAAVLIRLVRFYMYVCPHLNMLLFSVRDGEISYCDMPVPDHIVAFFKKRKDNQIMGLEVLSVALGMHRKGYSQHAH